MVNKEQSIEINPEPMPPDEAWWDSVLAEDNQHPQFHEKAPFNNHNHRGENLYAPPEQVAIDWDRARILYENDQIICLLVTNYNRGGLLVSCEGLQGFVPVSHLVEQPQSDSELEEWLAHYINLSLNLKVIECDHQRGRVVFSERAALAQPGVRNQLLENLHPGDTATGTITNITEFGVFVDLGGVEGLIHVSELSWGRVNHPNEVVILAQEILVYVIAVDRERARVALSLKRLYDNPWETAEIRYRPGQVAEAVITSIVPFGAFARLEDGLDGLIHVSEMCAGLPHTRPSDLVHEGQRVTVRILHVDGNRQRLGLSLNLNGNRHAAMSF